MNLPMRLIMLTLATLVGSMIIANVLLLNFTIMCMVPEMAIKNFSLTEFENTRNFSVQRSPECPFSRLPMFHWDKLAQSTALSAFSWGALAAVIPYSILTQRY